MFYGIKEVVGTLTTGSHAGERMPLPADKLGQQGLGRSHQGRIANYLWWLVGARIGSRTGSFGGVRVAILTIRYHLAWVFLNSDVGRGCFQ